VIKVRRVALSSPLRLFSRRAADSLPPSRTDHPSHRLDVDQRPQASAVFSPSLNSTPPPLLSISTQQHQAVPLYPSSTRPVVAHLYDASTSHARCQFRPFLVDPVRLSSLRPPSSSSEVHLVLLLLPAGLSLDLAVPHSHHSHLPASRFALVSRFEAKVRRIRKGNKQR
jgi:hypothetical protein